MEEPIAITTNHSSNNHSSNSNNHNDFDENSPLMHMIVPSPSILTDVCDNKGQRSATCRLGRYKKRALLLVHVAVVVVALLAIGMTMIALRVRVTVYRNRSSSAVSAHRHHYETPMTSTPTTTMSSVDDSTEEEEVEEISVAFVGNSMFYFNDFPRFFQVLSSRGNKRVIQNSCLHGGASIPSLLLEGNAMFPQFETPQAVLTNTNTSITSSSDSSDTTIHSIIYDYGACTVEQLLTGTDPRLDDPGYAVTVTGPEDKNSTHQNRNPCREDAAYLAYAKDYFFHFVQQQQHNHPTFTKTWDYVMINDNTRNPARASTRARSLQFLERFYLPWLIQTGATPVFLWTHAYAVNSTPTRNMAGLEDVANFTSLTGVGVRAYAQLLESALSNNHQTPRIAPVGLAFLLVHEEDPDLWSTLFHAADHIHASPAGTFLQGCIVYHTLFGTMPPPLLIIEHSSDHNNTHTNTTSMALQLLWKTARMMQHAWEPANPRMDVSTAAYLYRVAERIMVDGEIPTSYIDYQHGEVADEG